MSTATASTAWMSPEEYLRGEILSEIRHEYFAGEVFAMAGASEEHNFIAGNIFGELYAHLRGKVCAPFINDMKAHIQSEGDEWFYYPDVMVSCDPAGRHKYFCDTPSLIVEVLSPATESTDRREKRLAYEKIASLRTYVLAAQERREIIIDRRKPEGGWTRETLTATTDALRVPELEFVLPFDAIYARTGL